MGMRSQGFSRVLFLINLAQGLSTRSMALLISTGSSKARGTLHLSHVTEVQRGSGHKSEAPQPEPRSSHLFLLLFSWLLC